jgi:hypothetical protein
MASTSTPHQIHSFVCNTVSQRLNDYAETLLDVDLAAAADEWIFQTKDGDVSYFHILNWKDKDLNVQLDDIVEKLKTKVGNMGRNNIEDIAVNLELECPDGTYYVYRVEIRRRTN